MTHRVVISRKIGEIFADPAVQEELNTSQQKHAQQIFASGATTASSDGVENDDMAWCLQKLKRIYCQED